MQSLWGTNAAYPVSFLRGCWEDVADSGSKLAVLLAAAKAQTRPLDLRKTGDTSRKPQSCSCNNHKLNYNRYVFF